MTRLVPPLTPLLGLLVCAAPSLAAEPGWEQVSKPPLAIRQRTLPDSTVTEVEAKGMVRAAVQDVEAALLDCEAAPGFMPYLSECRRLGAPAADGTYDVYSRIAPPLVANRDYVLHMEVTRATPAKRSFRQAWTLAQDAVPKVSGVVRLSVNEGSWEGSANGSRTWLVYRVAADSGDGLSPTLVRMTTRASIRDLFGAVEREAQRRGKKRLEKGGT